MGAPPPDHRAPAPAWTRTATAVAAVSFLAFGLWAFADPESFFDKIATFHPYNQHLVQDIGAFQIGMGAVLLLAVLVPGQDAMAVGLLGVGAGSAVHVVSHIIGHDLGGRPETDIPFFIALTLLLVVPGIVRWRAASGGRS